MKAQVTILDEDTFPDSVLVEAKNLLEATQSVGQSDPVEYFIETQGYYFSTPHFERVLREAFPKVKGTEFFDVAHIALHAATRAYNLAGGQKSD